MTEHNLNSLDPFAGMSEQGKKEWEALRERIGEIIASTGEFPSKEIFEEEILRIAQPGKYYTSFRKADNNASK